MKFINQPLEMFVLLSIAVGLIVSSCTSTDILPSEGTPIFTSFPTLSFTPLITGTPTFQVTPTLTVTATVPASPTLLPTPLVPPIESFKNTVFDKNYLNDCKLRYPPAFDQQVGFHKVYPGITTENAIIDQLGESDENFEANEGKHYFYFDQSTNHAYSYFIVDNLVVDIDIISDSEFLIPLQNIFEKFGCPDLFVAVAAGNDMRNYSQDYNQIFLVYLDAGIRIRFDGYPINYSETPSLVSFVKPNSLNDFLELESDLSTGFLVSNSSVPVSFAEAVK